MARTNTPIPKVALAVRITPDLHAALRRLSVERGLSLNATVEDLLASAAKKQK